MKTIVTIVCLLTAVAGTLMMTRLATRTLHAEMGSPNNIAFEESSFPIIAPTLEKLPSAELKVTAPQPIISHQPAPVSSSLNANRFRPNALVSNTGIQPPTLGLQDNSKNTIGIPPVSSQSPKARRQGNGFAPMQLKTAAPSTFEAKSKTRNLKTESVDKRFAVANKQASSVSANYGWPPNAMNVRSLVRTTYLLPECAAESIVEFFSANDNERIETKIESNQDQQLVSLQVTTDEKTQRAIAEFLAAVYPKSRLDEIEKNSPSLSLDSPESGGRDFLPPDETEINHLSDNPSPPEPIPAPK